MILPSISLRKHYRKVPGEPSEPTSTVVLTSPLSYFIDIRVFKKQAEQDTLAASAKEKSLGDLQWAFAGQSSSQHDSAGRKFSSWKHWIDSLTDEPAEDKGEMISLAGGDVLEKGATRNEETGKVEEYEELWTEMPLVTPGFDEGNQCVVLKVEEHSGRTRGMVIKIGGWCQGILKKGESVTVERWCWEEGWKRVVRFGDEVLPCKDLVGLGDYEGDWRDFRCGGLGWTVVEVASW